MKWDEFSPYVMPYVIGCPIPTMVHHVKMAAIEFFRRTAAYSRTLDTSYTYGQASIDIEPLDSQTKISRLLSVTVDGRDFDLLEPGDGKRLMTDESTREFAFTNDLLTLTINPLQARQIPVVIDAVLVPRMDAATLSDEVAPLYAQDIAYGALSAIQRLPNQKFTNANEASVNFTIFNSRIATVAAKVSRGNAASKTRPVRRYC
jgi:hypothetical protein